MALTKTQEAVLDWMADGKTGLSSMAMAYYLAFGKIRKEDGRAIPHDPSDFNRCLGLLRAAPMLRKKLPEMAKLSKEWKRLVKAWHRIETQLDIEVGKGWSKSGAPAELTYNLMKEVLAGPPKKVRE